MIKTCQQCGKEFKLIPQEIKFYSEMKLPHPDNCPECRQQRREKLKNPRHFFKSTCAKCKQEIVTTHDPAKKNVVYCLDCYREFRANVDLTKEQL